ncbi:SDR family NAD(P)-dependent oxidoreductase [Thalassomonas haliotis]|uniref:SDR family NAD(P)-dependent oxidoreductase n=1 Tax=Thalassomonas haliotis TaxID=485448 RepID=A0ABY7VCS3_9GAMM|nr:SDR family NAD(P)-dependent oxidoreductase [Thalassomonas haliotis]WDE10929.1 SDR family NAD(P)-dependent oxidoreductase [Thalassomonas haliotis]
MTNNGPWALVTGGAQRIGAYFNQRLAKAGYNLVLHYHQSQTAALALKQQLEQHDVQLVLWQADLAEPQGLATAFQSLRSQVPQLDLLINNASIFEQGTLLESSLAQIQAHMHVHLTSPWLLIQEMMKCQNGQPAQIINILDANLAHRYTGKSAYFIAKKALETLTGLAAIECAPKVRVNALAPGFVLEAIDAVDGGPEHKDINLLQAKVPLNDLFSAIEFLQNNQSITGETINIDGGSHLQCPPYMLKN